MASWVRKLPTLPVRALRIAAYALVVGALLSGATPGAFARCRVNDVPPPWTIDTNESHYCLSCHDGVTARSPSLLGRLGSHPVGVDYRAAFYRRLARAGRWSRLRYPSSLDKRITLVKGNVECVTCHDMRSDSRGMLVMSNYRSELCTACHDI